jgi:hypothetical protein
MEGVGVVDNDWPGGYWGRFWNEWQDDEEEEDVHGISFAGATNNGDGYHRAGLHSRMKEMEKRFQKAVPTNSA